jgi:hypothetical protein
MRMRKSVGLLSAIVIGLVALSLAVGRAAVQEIEDTTATPGAGLDEPEPGPTEEQGYPSPFEYLTEGVEPVPYSITGSSRAQLKSAMDAAMSDYSTGTEEQHFGAVTVSEYTYEILGEPVRTLEISGDSCSCTVKGFIGVNLSQSIRYPVWIDMASCEDTALVRDWTGYIAATYSHELGHVYAARTGLTRLKSELGAIQTHEMGVQCTEVCDRAGRSYRRAVEDAFRRTTAEIGQAQNEYDSETGYGKDQGATF